MPVLSGQAVAILLLTLRIVPAFAFTAPFTLLRVPAVVRVLLSIALLWLSACTGTARLLNQFVLHPPPALTFDRIQALKAEAQAKYEQAQEHMRQARIDAAKEIGLTVASASARMAAQQVVGLIVVETIDIFIDEIRDIAVNGKVLKNELRARFR